MKIGLDFGSYSLKIATENKIISDENSVISVNADNGKAIAYGKESNAILGRTNDDIKTVYVIKDGVIADFTNAQILLDHYISGACKNRIYKPNVLITMPADSSTLEKKIFLDAVTLSGAGRVCITDGILASALGSSIPTDKMGGRMIIDIGHNITEIGIISLGTLVAKEKIKIGSSIIDESIIEYLKKDRDIIIGPHTAANLKTKIIFSNKRDNEVSCLVAGKNGLDSMPISFEITSTELFPIIDEALNTLVREIINKMQTITPELSQDSADHGITLCGGGALLFDILDRFNKEFNVEFILADDPLHARIKGIQMLMRDDSLMAANNYSYIFKDEIFTR